VCYIFFINYNNQPDTIKKNCPIAGLKRSTGFQEVKTPDFLTVSTGEW